MESWEESLVFNFCVLYYFDLCIFQGADGGGSDIGAFTGGLLGAVIKGIANPPGGVSKI